MTTVADLVAHLDASIPLRWAEPWDRVGLLAGDPTAPVERVLVALDPTPTALARALELSASVLLTHHPAFLDPLDRVVGDGDDRVVFDAVRAGVALVNCHTNLDRSVEGADALPDVIGLHMMGPLEQAGDDPDRPRAGRLCGAAAGETLETLARRVGASLGVHPRVWGRADLPIRRIGVAPGSGGSLVEAARAAGCDVLLTGELRYHGALAAQMSGLAVIEAGHDATEWPLTRALGRIAARTPGLDEGAVVVDDAGLPWWVA